MLLVIQSNGFSMAPVKQNPKLKFFFHLGYDQSLVP